MQFDTICTSAPPWCQYLLISCQNTVHRHTQLNSFLSTNISLLLSEATLPCLKRRKQCLIRWITKASKNTGFCCSLVGTLLKRKKKKSTTFKNSSAPFLLSPLTILHAFQLKWKVTEFPYFSNRKANSASSATIHSRRKQNCNILAYVSLSHYLCVKEQTMTMWIHCRLTINGMRCQLPTVVKSLHLYKEVFSHVTDLKEKNTMPLSSWRCKFLLSPSSPVFFSEKHYSN